MHTLWLDFRYGLRRLTASPGFTAAALLTLALGIGANTAIFTVVNAVMLRPLPVDRPEGLVEVYTTDAGGTPATSSYPDYLDYRDQATGLGGRVTAFNATLLTRSEGGRSELLFGEAVSGNFFDVLGLRPTLGRTFGPEDDQPGRPHVALLGYGMWQRRYGGDPSIVGRALTISGQPVTVIGVMPERYKGSIVGLEADLWIPLHTDFAFSPARSLRTERGSRRLFLRARLADGQAIAQAQAELDVVAARLAAEHPATNQNRKVYLVASNDVRIHPEVDKVLAPVAALLMVVPGLVLLIACANVANLLLARASGRTREVAVRLAIGASRRRLVQQLLTESVTLSVAGGVLGLGLAYVLMRLAAGWRPEGLPVPLTLDLSMDPRVFVFAFGLAVATGVIFGLAPALQATRPDLVPALKDEGGAGLRAHRRFGLRNVLVVVQVAVSLVLLAAAGLFVRSLQQAQLIDPGFESVRAVVLSPILSLTEPDPAVRHTLTMQIKERLAALPGVERVALADRAPLGASVRTSNLLPEGVEPDADGRGVDIDAGTIGPGYFAVMSVPIVAGRDFNDGDTLEAPRVAIVSDAFARRFWPDQNPIGRLVRMPVRAGVEPGAPFEVVGVARDTKVRTLGEAPRPYFYRASTQQPNDDPGFIIRTAGAPEGVVEPARQAVLAVAPDAAIMELQTMRQHLGLMLTPPRMAAALLGVSGLLALLLAAVGLYAVVAYSVARRTKEIGIRVALGATRGAVVWLVVREGMALVLVGITLGVTAAFAVAQPLSGYLYGARPVEPLTFAAVASVLAGVALVANYLPARRAVRVDPLRSIRYE